MTAQQILVEVLQPLANETNVAGMRRFGIVAEPNLGVSVLDLRRIAKKIGRSQPLAEELWTLGYRETRLLATFLGEPGKLTKATMNRWVRDLDSWDICDACACDLFDRSPFAVDMAQKWSTRKHEFQKRAAFSLMAGLARHAKAEPDETFRSLLQVIEREACDDRNYVKKAVNWALREIGKRNPVLLDAAFTAALDIQSQDCRAARWIAADALREFNKILNRSKERSPAPLRQTRSPRRS